MTVFKARRLFVLIALVCVAFSDVASAAGPDDLWVTMNVSALVGLRDRDTVSFDLTGTAYVRDLAQFGVITAFELKGPNGSEKISLPSISTSGQLASSWAIYPDPQTIPAGIYTMTVTGSIAGTKTYKFNVDPRYIPGPISTAFIETTRTALSSARLSSFTLNFDHPVSYADTAYLYLGVSSTTLYSETRRYIGNSGSVILPLNLLVPGQAATFSAQYQNVSWGPDNVYVYYGTSYWIDFVAASAPAPTQLANISARGYCGTGDRVMIGGFVVDGNTAKRVLVRALGPTLTTQGIGQSEVLLDPTIEVYRGTERINANDNWTDNVNWSEISVVTYNLGAGRMAAGDTTSSALLLTLEPGVYTFIANGKAGTSGITLLEVYDLDSNSNGGRFVNISTRAYSTTGNGVAIGGFVLSGSAPKQVLLRAVGPTLTKLGIRQADVLADPTIELHDATHGNVVIATNDNWGDNPNAAALTSTAARIGANAFDAADTNSSALLMTLAPGAYTFIASGKNNTSGIVLVEVYDAD